jgi:hypothetical protein
MNGPIRLRQHGTFDLVHKKIHNVNFFVNKTGFFRPAGACPERSRMGRYPPPNVGCLIPISSGRFAVFAHVVVFVVQTPTA